MVRLLIVCLLATLTQVSTMKSDDDQYRVIDEDGEEDLSFYPIDSVDISEDTEFFFDGAWSIIADSIEDEYPNMKISDPMCSEDDDGFLGIWARVDCGHSALWIRVMTLGCTRWCWSDEEYH